jgi:transcriptional regulator with PAS, ATPase and Fis domain
VGKGLIAHKIHDLSSRASSPFVHVNCAAIPDSLFEAEIFGYEEGAFTGARRQGKPGLLELAADGTVFLDEIAELPYSLQAKLLQVLQEAVFRRVGGISPIRLKARIISATNQNVEELMRLNRFREDLYYRLCVVPIHVPSLLERRDDIPLYADLFLKKYNAKYGVRKRLARDVKDWMYSYAWPGNVRELQNMIERLAIISEGEEISLRDIPESYRRKARTASQVTLEESISLKEANEKMEKVLVERVLRSNRTTREAAQALGVSQATLLRKASKYGFSCSAPDRIGEGSH